MKEVAAGIAIIEGRALLTRRAPGQNLEGYWEFPGGKLELGEDAQTCIVRELREELGVESTAGNVLATSEYTYPGGQIRLIAVEVKLHGDDFTLTVHDEYAWIELAELLELNLAPADIPIVEELIARHGSN